MKDTDVELFIQTVLFLYLFYAGSRFVLLYSMLRSEDNE